MRPRPELFWTAFGLALMAPLGHAQVIYDIGQTQPPTAQAPAVPSGLPASKSDVTWPKAAPGVRELYSEYQNFVQLQARTASRSSFKSTATMATTRNGMVAVEAIADGNPEILRATLEDFGMENTAVAGYLVSGMLPIQALPEVADLYRLRSLRLSAMRTHVGAVTSQGDAAMRADVARASRNIDGSGVTVGVLSDSYDCYGERGDTPAAADDINTGDLPNSVTVLQDYSAVGSCATGGIDEGRAMLQIVHDVAPGADLAFHTAQGGQANFAQGILDLANVANADIIVDDIIYLAEPMFQDGVVAQAVDTVREQGVAYFSSAGNNARDSYHDAFSSGSTYGSGDFAGLFWGGVGHAFGAGDDLQQVTLAGGGSVTLVLQWSDPFPSVSGGTAATDLDFYLLDDPPTQVLASSTADQGGGADPVEIISVTNNGGAPVTVNLMIAKYSGANPDRLQYIAFQNGFSVNEYDTQSPTCYGHANAAGAFAVGAAAWFDTPEFGVDPPELEYFSSAGGIPILFDETGSPVFIERRKPEFTAPDGGNTTFFGSDISADVDSYPNFFGTSASAPHAAAQTGLMLASLRGASVPLLLSGTQSSCVDIMERSTGQQLKLGFDSDSGAGLVDANNGSRALLGRFYDQAGIVRIE